MASSHIQKSGLLKTREPYFSLALVMELITISSCLVKVKDFSSLILVDIQCLHESDI